MRQPWRDKSAIISGGSSGLGLHLALALAQQRAKLLLIGRDPVRLQRARETSLEAGASEVLAIAMDIADECQWTSGDGDPSRFRQWLDRNPLHLLINAVGRSDRGMLENLKPKDLLDQFQTNVVTTFRMTQACLPSLRRGSGTVVDIASLAGIIAAPGMGAYCLAKHALVAMHRQWRLELHASNLHFLLVCPGPIERDDSEHRYDTLAASRGISEQQAGPGGGVRLNRLNPKTLSEQILDAAAGRQSELIVPGKARWLAALMPTWPRFADKVVRKKFS